MLSLLMRIVVDGAAILHSAPVVDPATVGPSPVVSRAMPACGSERRRAGAATDRPGPLSRDEGEARRYLLFDLRDRNNCPTPISYDVPGQGRALGRNLLSSDPARPQTPMPRAPSGR